MNDVYSCLARPVDLSEGQQYRFRLAMAIAAQKRFVFADEFCSGLDRISASVISYNIYKLARQHGRIFFLASSHEDILADLSPDVMVVKDLTGDSHVIYKRRRRGVKVKKL